ncbi:MAG: cytochrome-c oxidase, cbb3-type subunit I [Zetaproteobacteria bacterium CG2_30_46_52]|nr:MAG: cytochrome-c oxidase, cbb3-type subunit I [Zetaproteobacteria bacterium CG2_30_46_52]
MSSVAEKDQYNYDIVKFCVITGIVMGVLGTLVGTFVASELAFPWLNMDIAEISFGRLRPVHTNVVIFGFGGFLLYGAGLYMVQHTTHARIAFEKVAWTGVALWLIGCLAVVVTLPLGMTQAKEYHEAEWWIDIILALSWVCLTITFLGTVARRKMSHIYVGLWFFMTMLFMVTYIFVFNGLCIPVDMSFSYSAYAGIHDAMTQWWWGHNAVGFFLTAGFIGVMYYFVPKHANRPIYSYRLSVLHFWSLTFLYVWVGAHHLHYTAIPDWTLSLGAGMSVALIFPSWGGMINGMMTMSGAWDKLRTDPVMRFMVVALAFYGMSTFEGPLMGTKSVNALSHYTDWTVGHVHSGALGWNAMIAIGAMYHMITRMWNTEMASEKLVNLHFWIHLTGAVFYITAMWGSGVLQGLMWRAFDEYGNLVYTFADSVAAMHPFYALRALGGFLVFLGLSIMLFNTIKTIGAVKAGTNTPLRAAD